MPEQQESNLEYPPMKPHLADDEVEEPLVTTGEEEERHLARMSKRAASSENDPRPPQST